jgi:hypothetical protein
MKVKKVAIPGGEIYAFTAAVKLTREADWKERYDITTYQIG